MNTRSTQKQNYRNRKPNPSPKGSTMCSIRNEASVFKYFEMCIILQHLINKPWYDSVSDKSDYWIRSVLSIEITLNCIFLYIQCLHKIGHCEAFRKKKQSVFVQVWFMVHWWVGLMYMYFHSCFNIPLFSLQSCFKNRVRFLLS